MIFDVRHYDPDQPDSPVTWAWHTTQSKVSALQFQECRVFSTFFRPVVFAQSIIIMKMPCII